MIRSKNRAPNGAEQHDKSRRSWVRGPLGKLAAAATAAALSAGVSSCGQVRHVASQIASDNAKANNHNTADNSSSAFVETTLHCYSHSASLQRVIIRGGELKATNWQARINAIFKSKNSGAQTDVFYLGGRFKMPEDHDNWWRGDLYKKSATYDSVVDPHGYRRPPVKGSMWIHEDGSLTTAVAAVDIIGTNTVSVYCLGTGEDAQHAQVKPIDLSYPAPHGGFVDTGPLGDGTPKPTPSPAAQN